MKNVRSIICFSSKVYGLEWAMCLSLCNCFNPVCLFCNRKCSCILLVVIIWKIFCIIITSENFIYSWQVWHWLYYRTFGIKCPDWPADLYLNSHIMFHVIVCHADIFTWWKRESAYWVSHSITCITPQYHVGRTSPENLLFVDGYLKFSGKKIAH